ncbi:MAG TPA: hypothetical protein VKU02_28305 [Gemmataceae bacterium]|nr:hypothetical protein [Gemmataceae bacterium]
MKLLSKIALVLLALAFVAPYAEARGCRHRCHGHRHVHVQCGGCCR